MFTAQAAFALFLSYFPINNNIAFYLCTFRFVARNDRLVGGLESSATSIEGSPGQAALEDGWMRWVQQMKISCLNVIRNCYLIYTYHRWHFVQ